MLNILKENYFTELYSNGFVDTGVSVSDEMVDEIRQHYRAKQEEERRNDFPKFFQHNEHQAYLEGKTMGMLFNTFPKFAQKMVKSFYDKTYKKAVYCDQTFLEKILNHMLNNGFQRFFETRYMVVSYDVYFRNDHQHPGAGIHFDIPNFHHFYETENDLSIYVPLVDLTEENGGRLTVLPESKLKVPGNVMLKLLHEHFSDNRGYVDADGYVDPNRISFDAMGTLVKTKPYQDLMMLYKSINSLARKQYAHEFRPTPGNKGKVILFNNKNFHAVEKWHNTNMDRDVYTIRLLPIYDIKVKLKKNLHGTPFNNYLLDTKTGEMTRFEESVDVSRIEQDYKMKL